MNQDPANSLSPNATVSAQTNNQPTQQVAAPASYAAPQAASTASSLNMAPAKVAAAAGVESEAEAAAVDSTAAQYSTVGSVHLQNAPAATNNTDRAAGSSVVTSSAAISIVVNTPAPNSAAKSAESTNLAPLAQTEHSTLPTAAAAAACPLHFPPRPLPPQQDAEPLSPQESTPQVPSSLLQPLYSWRQLPRSEQEFFLLLNRELNANSMAVVNLAPIPLLKSDYYRDTSVPSLQLQVHVNASEWISPMVYQQEENAGFSDVQTAQIFSAYTNELLSSYSHQFQVLSSLNSALKCYWGKQLAALAKTKAEEAASVSAAATEVSGAGAATSKAKELYSWRDVSVQIPYSHLAKEALFNADSGVEMCEALIEDVRSFYSEAELCTQLFLSFVLHGTPSELKDYQQFVIAHAQDLACVPQAWQALTQALIKHCKSGVTLSRASFAQALAFLPEDDGAVAQWEQLQKEHSFICLTLTQCAETLQHILVFMGKVQMWINLFGLTVCNIKESYDETQNNLMTLLNAHPLNNRQHSAATAEDYREAFARRNDKKYISTGHKYLDAIIHGYYLGGVSILAAYSGTGKTWFGIDATVHALQQGLCVGFFSTEMSLDSMHERLLQYLLNCDYQTLHKVVPEKALQLALDLVCSWSKDKSAGPHFNLYCPSSNLDRISIEMIEQEVTTAAASERGFDFVVVDYLQDVENNTCKDAEVYKRYLNSMRRLVSLGIKFNCAILLLAQMRPSEHSYSSGMPSLYEIAEGSYVVNSAQAVMFLRNCKVQSKGQGKGKGQEQETDDRFETYLQVVKNRAGSSLSTSKLKCTRSAGSHFTFVPENSY